jgi:UDP-N-acetylglucosamine--N-acetylmuramyl-(pentapeptide) pyrophosphoryl-undecaprenol N-acetylglucosamine transferase
MIFATTGTCEPFDRLIQAFDGLDLDEELVVQHGVSPVRPSGARCVDFLAYGDLVELVRRARVVVTHGGVGSVLTALANGKRPVVVPRSAARGEAIDDHQLELVRKLAAAGVVDLVEDTADLPARLVTAGAAPVTVAPDARLVSELREYLTAAA